MQCIQQLLQMLFIPTAMGTKRGCDRQVPTASSMHILQSTRIQNTGSTTKEP